MIQRHHNCMQDVLELLDVPDVDGEETEEMQHMRVQELVPYQHQKSVSLPFHSFPEISRRCVCFALDLYLSLFCIYIYTIALQEDEQFHGWSIQDGDNILTRRALPPWMTQPLEMRVCQFVTDYGRWQDRIAKRTDQGKTLTKRQELAYATWKSNSVHKLIFCKSRKTLITDAKDVSATCIGIRLHLSEEPEKLQLSTGDGSFHRLVLLRGPKNTTSSSSLPAALDAPVAADMIPDDDPEEAEAESEEEKVLDGEVPLEDAVGNDDMDNGDGDESCILADSDDDLDLFGIELDGHSCQMPKVKNFHNRQAWRKLDELGLASIPTHVNGCSISFHSTTSQWQGYYPNVHTGLCCTFGGKSKRSDLGLLKTCFTPLFLLKYRMCIYIYISLFEV